MPAVGLLLTAVLGLSAWIVLWALGVNALDAFFIAPALVLAGAMSQIARAVPIRGRREGRVDSMRRAWVAGGVLVGIGLGLWLAALVSTKDVPGRLSDLGSGLLGGAVVAFAVFFLELRSQQSEELNSLRLTIGLQQDLSRADLSGRDLSRTVLNGKDLTKAVFANAKLRQAGFVSARLVEASFVNADLTKAVFSLAELDGATFAGADLTAAIFADARDVEKADFKTACYRNDEAPVFSGPTPPGIAKGCA
jgi:hypothetical protein